MVAHRHEGRDHLHRYLKSGLVPLSSWLYLCRGFRREKDLKVRRKEPMAYVLGPGVSGVHPVVGGGGMVVNRRRGDEASLCRAGFSVSVLSDLLVVLMDGSPTDLASVGLR